ncbi:MAG: 16S rRNA (cytosine(1402)-N(4))-methyltransferase RsmH [Planctomycetota bacterium]
MTATVHVPVLPSEVLEHLRPAPGGVFVDGTLGGGGHARAIAEAVSPGGRVLAIDLDPAAIEAAEASLAGLPIELHIGSYTAVPEMVQQAGLDAVDGVLLDLGLSSDQLADHERGFSFDAAGPLDLRFDPTRGEPAWRMLRRMAEKDIADVLYHYGEERYSRRIARKVVARNASDPIEAAGDFAALVRSCVPRSRTNPIDPATRSFQALRIAVNEELKSVETALRLLPGVLRPGGRLAIISFHSLEDRLVKHAFRDDPRLDVVTRRPVTASDSESQRNPRSRSAKLRVAERD